jgi:hypothetical protein
MRGDTRYKPPVNLGKKGTAYDPSPTLGMELVVRRNTGIKSLTPHPETATGTGFMRNWADPNVFRAAAPWLFGAGAGGYLYN